MENIVTEKKCTGCGEVKPITSFYKDRNNSSGYGAKCGICKLEKWKIWFDNNRERASETAKKWAKRNPDKVKEKQRRFLSKQVNKDKGYVSGLNSKYGLSKEEYFYILKKQDNLCAICKKNDGKRLHVDHNHKTGRVRGLVCGKCNRALGLLKDNISALENAISYLMTDVVEKEK